MFSLTGLIKSNMNINIINTGKCKSDVVVDKNNNIIIATSVVSEYDEYLSNLALLELRNILLKYKNILKEFREDNRDYND